MKAILGEKSDRVCVFLEVDEAFGDAKRQDGTGGRGANGDITRALEQEHGRV